MKFAESAMADLEVVRNKGTRQQKDYILTVLKTMVWTIGLREVRERTESTPQSSEQPHEALDKTAR